MSMLGVYVVMCVGIVVAFLALIAEILWKRRARLGLINMTRRFVTTAHSTGRANAFRINPLPFFKNAFK